MGSILEIKNVSKSFGKNKVVDNVTLNVNEGEIFGFLGPNGARKNYNNKNDIGAFKHRRRWNKG